MTGAAIWMADLLRALLADETGNIDAAARALGFERGPPPQKEPPPQSPSPQAFVATEPPPQTIADRPLQPALFWQPVHFEERPADPPGQGAPTRKPVWRNRPKQPPPFHPLAPWRELEPRLRRAITTAQDGVEIDVERVVEIWSRGHELPHLPREKRHRWPGQVTVILDRALHLWPFTHDQLLLLGALRAWLPEGALQEAVWPPGADAPYLDDPGSIEPRPWQTPAPGSVVLVLGDLGCLRLHHADPGRPWRRLGEEIRAAGAVPVALFPGALARVPPDLRRLWRVLPWERATQSGPAETAAAADRLIGLLSHAVRIEPGLLRAVRRAVLPGADAGVESEVWQHRAVESGAAEAATLAPDDARALHGRLAAASEEECRAVLDLWRSWRFALPDVIWFEEILNLPKSLQERLPHGAADLADAENYMEWRVAGDLDGAIAAREYLHRAARRATADGWATGALAKAILAAKAIDDPDYNPRFPVDVRWVRGGTPGPLTFWQCGKSVRAVQGRATPTEPGSFLGRLASDNGRWHCIDLFWAAGKPPPWADDWGTDEYGHWVTFHVPQPDGSPVTQRMRWCPPGTFLMGSPEDEAGRWENEGPQHRVTISHGFWMFDTACTWDLWSAVMGGPIPDGRGRHPATDISWQDARDFARAINAPRPGLALSLPSEAQWEYACRAGTTTPYSFGTTFDGTRANIGAGTVPVGSLPCNPWGLHEMQGNVWEWCEDVWHDSYVGAPADGSARGGAAALRVLRGGSWFNEARVVRSASRAHGDPRLRYVSFGFRCARVQAASEAEQVAAPADPARRTGAERVRPQGPTGAATLLRPGEAAECPPPRRGTLLIRSDREELTFRRLTRPDWADAVGRDVFGLFAEFTLHGTDITQRLRWIPPGRFDMGSPADEPGRLDWEGPRHPVTLAEGFWMFDTPCTQALWQAVMGKNPSEFRSPTRPVEQVSFHDVERFLAKLNARQPGLDLMLPSEAQWEYACRAGTDTATYAGPIDIIGAHNAPVLDPIAWYGGNSGQDFDLKKGYNSADWPYKQHDHTMAGTRRVGQKAANPWGLYDMLGNVWEWCADDWHDSYEGAPSDGSPRSGASDGAAAYRVLRGGSWLSVARYVRSAYRFHGVPASRFDYIGFRCARVQGDSEAQAGAEGREERAQRAERGAATTSPQRQRTRNTLAPPGKRS